MKENMGTTLSKSEIDAAIKHYSNLFSLPSSKIVFALLSFESFLLGLMISPSPCVINGFMLGVIFGAVIIAADYLVANIILRKDIILNFRRLSFLSFSANLSYIFSAAIEKNIIPEHLKSPELFIKILAFSLFVSLSLRLLVISSISFFSLPAKIISSSLQPSILLLLTIFIRVKFFSIHHLAYIVVAAVISALSVSLFTFSLNKCGKKMFNISSLEIFRAFLANWAEDLEGPFEKILERLGEEHDVTVSLLIFRSKDSERLKAIMVVPNLHPGPFKNIGSSSLPSLIGNLLENEYGCVVSVPHGISGHSLDLVSQLENKKVLERLLEDIKKPHKFSSNVTNFFTVERGMAKVGCQIFDKCAFLTLTLSPETMEDLPIELNETIIRKAFERGFSWAIVVDSHNSIDGPFNIEGTVEALEEAAVLALDKAEKLTYFSNTLMVGAGKVKPRDLGVKDGIGPGGITAIVIGVNGQKTAYITIDGNNMVSGLREKILLNLKDLGIDGGEVFTTDTHIVNAVVQNKRGYYPVGEIIDHVKIIEYVKRSTIEALNNMEAAEVAWHKAVIPKVKVIGELQINNLGKLTNKVLMKAKRNSLIFIVSGLLLIVLFMVI